MPEIKTATVLTSEPAGPGFHTLVAEAHAPLAALPGQWGAFHTEIPNPEKPGQTLRRAWSFAQIGETRFRLFVATVGPATRWLAARKPGDSLPFTGPWGSRFRLDDGVGPAGFFAAGSGISPIGAMVDACIARGRPARLLWETAFPTMPERIAAWRAAGVDVEVGSLLRPVGPETWWFAGDGARLDEVVGDAPAERIERFYTPRPALQATA
jgi:NAD(P)H-flavin reductase